MWPLKYLTLCTDKQTDGRTNGRTDNVKTLYPPTNTVCEGYKIYGKMFSVVILAYPCQVKYTAELHIVKVMQQKENFLK